jgi:hypothetical protein
LRITTGGIEELLAQTTEHGSDEVREGQGTHLGTSDGHGGLGVLWVYAALMRLPGHADDVGRWCILPRDLCSLFLGYGKPLEEPWQRVPMGKGLRITGRLEETLKILSRDNLSAIPEFQEL